jgi:hypothetical protein
VTAASAMCAHCDRCDDAGHARDVRIAYLARMWGIAHRVRRTLIAAILDPLDGTGQHTRCAALEQSAAYKEATVAEDAARAALSAALDADAAASAAEVGA